MKSRIHPLTGMKWVDGKRAVEKVSKLSVEQWDSMTTGRRRRTRKPSLLLRRSNRRPAMLNILFHSFLSLIQPYRVLRGPYRFGCLWASRIISGRPFLPCLLGLFTTPPPPLHCINITALFYTENISIPRPTGAGLHSVVFHFCYFSFCLELKRSGSLIRYYPNITSQAHVPECKLLLYEAADTFSTVLLLLLLLFYCCLRWWLAAVAFEFSSEKDEERTTMEWK